MKRRWIAPVVLAFVLALGACAPPGGGEAGDATPTASPSAEPAESMPDETEAADQGNPDDYGY